MSWEYTFKKAGYKNGRKIPTRVEARKHFEGPVQKQGCIRRYDASNVLLVAYADGRTTVSMNGATPMDSMDIHEMANVMSDIKDMLEKGPDA